MPAGVSNGSSIKGERRARMILALAKGDSITAIAERFSCTRDTVRALDRAAFAEIGQRKERLAAQAEQIALKAFDQLNDHLDNSRLPANILVPIGGMATDKLLALRGDSVSTIRHIHSVDLTDDDLIAFAVSRSEKRAKAAVVEVQALPDAEQAPSANTRNRNPPKH
jgi:transposase-like protein